MKKILSLTIVAVFLFTVILGASIFASKIGDLNDDGNIDNKDVVLLFRAVSGSGEVDKTAADFNKDDSVDNKDVVALFRYVSSDQPDETTDPGDTTDPEEQIDPDAIEYASSFTVSKVFGKNMVIQRNEIIRVWGWAPESENGKYVKAEFSGLTGYGEVKDGEWMLKLNGMLPENTTAQTMTISGNNTSVEITGVLVGDVYWISGQSNIAYSVSNIKNEPLANELGRKVDTGNSLLIRLNRTNQTDIYNAVATVGTNDVSKDVVNKRGWQTAKFGASAFSALGYFTAYMLYNKLDCKVPIGMIEFDGNGMALHGFLPNEVRDNLKVSTKNANGVYSASGVNQHASSYMYNHGMYAFQNFPICGFIWYQGESDCSSANNNCYAYAERFTAFINYIREKHDLKTNHDYPVYIVELSPSFPYNSSGQANQYIDFATVRMNMGSIPTMLNNAHICSTEDLWKDKEYNNNLHPYNKWELAERMTNMILSYGLDIGDPADGEGPIVDSFTLSADGKTATVKFKNVGDGLAAQGGVLKGFKVAVSTTNYTSWNEPTTQTISGKDTVVLTYTRAIKKVAYNNSLANTFPEAVTLCNSGGIPCAAFAISE